MKTIAHSKLANKDMDFRYGRSLIFTIRRHGVGESEQDAAKTAQNAADKALLGKRD